MTQEDPATTPNSNLHSDSSEPEIISLDELHQEEQSSDTDELAKTRPQITGEQSAAGSMPNPELVTAKTTLERVEKLFPDQDPDKP